MKFSMRKMIITLVSVALLGGCTQYNGDLEADVRNHLERSNLLEAEEPNSLKPYYSYYLEPSIGRVSSSATGNVFSYEGTQFLMNLNVSSILNGNSKKKDTTAKTDLSLYMLSIDGTYFDSGGTEHAYQLNVLEKEVGYLTLFTSDVVAFYCISDQATVGAVSGMMLKIARSVKVDKEALQEGYTSGKKLNYHSEKVQLFESTAPEKGVVEELFGNTSVAGTEIDVNEEGGKQIETDESE